MLEEPYLEGPLPPAHMRGNLVRGAFEAEAFKHYDLFKSQGCDALMFTFDRDHTSYTWTGLKGSKAQIAASLHRAHSPVNSNFVIAVLDLALPKKELVTKELAKWSPFACPVIETYISPAFEEAANHHDKDTFNCGDNVARTLESALSFSPSEFTPAN